MGPTLTVSSRLRADSRKVMAWPRGGGVQHDEVGHVGPLQLPDLAEQQDVLDARRSRGHHVERPEDTSRREMRDSPWSRRYFEQRGVRTGAGLHVGRAVRAATRRQHHSRRT